ncbi:MAG: hypothetical protein PHU61_03100 [Candidatus Absconditabacteria bacterium]|nr:hypothetical protein [Candidatus Absconditabacteria bacterium]MDD3868231.1 hypothetical protein [Candidatus Absconditabacteria bacterium]MDD4714641.1 hypothetical protein [Candidatus Absconditabacteria bacterium]
MNMYKIASLIKVTVGAIILLIDYTMINVFEDPAIGIGLALVGVFLLGRGGSFFLFFFIQELFRKIEESDRNLKDSYKLSLLFGLYSLINILLLFLGIWSKRRGIFLLAGFILLQYFLFLDPKHVRK